MSAVIETNEMIAPAARADTGCGTRTAVWLRLTGSPWTLVVVLCAATLIRFWDVTRWSLWEDEETTIFFSQQLQKPFPSFFPIFFALLGWLYDLTGVSTAAGRFFAASLGVLNIALVYACFRKMISGPVALLTALLLAINLGHLFWSQSIRYFMLALTFQLLCATWAFVGFERKSYLSLILSSVALTLALLTHFSAVLLAPVLIAYVALMILRRESDGYNWKAYLVFGLPFLLVLAIFAKKFLQLRVILADMPLASARDPIHLAMTTTAYFGLPAIGLGLLYPLLVRRALPRAGWFLLLLAIIPVLELVVIARLNLANVTWYYGLVSLLGFSGLAALTLVHLYEKGWAKLSTGLIAGALAYSLVFLAGYYTTMHGDRPRWKDAAEFVRRTAGVNPDRQENPEIFATVPGVVAHYLGVDPGATMGHGLVRMVPQQPPMRDLKTDQWYVVEAGHATKEYTNWLRTNCILKANFEAHTGPVDRSVGVYFYAGKKTR